MAWKTTTRSSGAVGIPRRSWRRRRPGAVVDDDVDLGDKQLPDLVKNMRKIRIRRKGKEKRHGVAVVHRRRRFHRRRMAECRARFRAAWGLSKRGFWGKRKRRGRAIRGWQWRGRLRSGECELKREVDGATGELPWRWGRC